MNEYYEKVKYVKEKLTEYLNEIFESYNNELPICINDCNLLQSEHNCIETSTATGYILEEFVVSKLEAYSKNHSDDKIRIERIINHGTQKTSYDCFVNYENIFFMINIKVDKKSNIGVAAINILHKDYVVDNPEQEKAYIVLKVHYGFGKSKTSNERKLLINRISTFALEEVDFTLGHRQDHRNWGKEYKSTSGRLQISNRFRKENSVAEDEISYNKTKIFIENIYKA